MGALSDLDPEQVGQGGEQVNTGRQGVAGARGDARVADHQGDVAEGIVDRHAGLSPDVLLAQVVPVVGAHHDQGVLGQSLVFDGLEDPPQPVVDHRQLGTVAGPQAPGAGLAQNALRDRPLHVGRPDHRRALIVGVVHRGPGLRGVEGLVRVEFVDEQEEPVVPARVLLDPAGSGGHGPRTGEVRLPPEPAPAVMVGHVIPSEDRRARPAGIRPGLPGIPLVPALVGPGGEVGVVVLAAGLEQVGVIRDELRDHAGLVQLVGDGVLPDLHRPPGPPEEVQGTAEDVVARRHAGQGARMVVVEPDGGAPEGVEIGGGELGPAIGAQHVPVQAVQQDDDRIPRRGDHAPLPPEDR